MITTNQLVKTTKAKLFVLLLFVSISILSSYGYHTNAKEGRFLGTGDKTTKGVCILGQRVVWHQITVLWINFGEPWSTTENCTDYSAL